MEPSPAEVRKVLRALAETAARLAAVTRGLDEGRLRRRPEADSWSASEILAHLMACADVWGGSIVMMISADTPRLRYVSPRSWIRKTGYLEEEFSELLKGFRTKRSELLKVLRALPTPGWSRGATFSGTTKGRDETIFSYAVRIAEHEVRHLGQIERAVAPGRNARAGKAR